MRWWGWGVDEQAMELPEASDAALREALGVEAGGGAQPVSLEDVRLPEPSLPESLVSALGGIELRQDPEARITHAVGKSYPDLVRIRSGDGSSAPDAVLGPASVEELQAALKACADASVAVTPFGGGSSVVGGVEPVRDGFAAAVSLDLGKLDKVRDVDRESLTVTFDPGLFGPALEARLQGRGLTLGHFPQSFEFSTVGGWVATRSAGQASTGYGRIDELVEAVRCVAPGGEVVTKDVPATAAGPDLRQLLVGSEGVLGVLCDLTLRVRPLPEARRYEGWSFPSFEEGVAAFKRMEQEGRAADVARLSDEEETRLTITLASSGSLADRAGKAYLRMRGHGSGCIAILGFEGDPSEVNRRSQATAELLRESDGVALGVRPGGAWLRNRFATPYLRDELLNRGVLVETLETAGTWSGLRRLYEAVGDALRSSLGARGTPPLVMCHVSHLYPSGASLYFTFMARQERGAELDQWRAAKTAACDAIVAAGGTITHHHAIGRDHAPWMTAEVGETGLELIRAAKERLDPRGVMNPGKLLPHATLTR
jgi:alkyldihydroxyacetonephosphate synthase